NPSSGTSLRSRLVSRSVSFGRAKAVHRSAKREGGRYLPMDLLARVRRTIRDHRLAQPDTRVVVALSGGADSVALAHLVRELDAAGELRAAGAAHFNHQLRATAERDERFSVGLAESFGWPIVTDREDVAARARRERRSL